jgi:hypothetical protein
MTWCARTAVCAVIVGLPASLRLGQLRAQQLPVYTTDQRWANIEWSGTEWVVLAIRYAEMMGQSPEQLADSIVELVEQTWASEQLTPLGLLASAHRGATSHRHGEFQVLEASSERVRYRVNRPYVAEYFGKDMQEYGVTVKKFEAFFNAYRRKIYSLHGIAYESRIDEDWLYVTLSKQ